MVESNKKSFVFISQEGNTQPPFHSDYYDEMDNLQVIGFAKGMDMNDAFKNLLNDNPTLLETAFNELICYELAFDYLENQKYFFINDEKNKKLAS